MPLFDYRCDACGRVFEMLVRGDATVQCPDCQTATCERLMPLPARPAGGGDPSPDPRQFGPPPGGGCCGGGCAH